MCVSFCVRVSVSSCILPSCVHPTFFKSQHRPQVCLRLVYWRVWIRICVNTRDGKKVLFSNGNFFAHECFLWTNYLYADSNKKITIRRLWISSSNPKRHQKKTRKILSSLSLNWFGKRVFIHFAILIMKFSRRNYTIHIRLVEWMILNIYVCIYIFKAGNDLIFGLGRFFFQYYIFKYV